MGVGLSKAKRSKADIPEVKSEKEYFLCCCMRLLFLVPQDTRWLCRALSVTNVFVWETGGVSSHRKICMCICVPEPVMDGIGGDSQCFSILPAGLCVLQRDSQNGRERQRLYTGGVSLSLARSLSHTHTLPWGDSMCACPLACPSVWMWMSAVLCVCLHACLLQCLHWDKACQGGGSFVWLWVCVCVCVCLLSSQGEASGHIGSCDRQPYLSASLVFWVDTGSKAGGGSKGR